MTFLHLNADSFDLAPLSLAGMRVSDVASRTGYRGQATILPHATFEVRS